MPTSSAHAIPAVIIAGLSGSSGKSLCSIGLIRALRSKGRNVVSFKKGPDFIDSAWLSKSAGNICRNLDAYMMNKTAMRRGYESASAGKDICVIEGNRGLYDGMDKHGTYSTAALAEFFKIPVVLVVDCTKMTGTAAALVLGCRELNPRINISGVILNRVNGPRHIRVVKEAIEAHAGVPVIGAFPKLKDAGMQERHLGLMPVFEQKKAESIIEWAKAAVLAHVDVNRVMAIASKCAAKAPSGPKNVPSTRSPGPGRRKVGVIMDRAFNFYYPENLEAFTAAGAELIEINSLKDKALPAGLDLLYIGGGFPETSAPLLEKNRSFRLSIRKAVEKGLHVFAECGGVVYLGRKLTYKGKKYAMSGVIPIDFDFSPRPRGHGYTELRISGANPFFKTGTLLKGHEFHYTGPVGLNKLGSPDKVRFAADVRRGFGFDGVHDGLVYKNVYASYTHIHALGVPGFARRLLRL